MTGVVHVNGRTLVLSVSADHQRRGDGLVRIWIENENAYLPDAAGEVLTFGTPYEAERYIRALEGD